MSTGDSRSFGGASDDPLAEESTSVETNERSVLLLADSENEIDRFLIHARALSGLLAYVRDQGLSCDDISQELSTLDLSNVRADAFDGFISMNRFGKLMRRFGRLLDDEAIGLHAAAAVDQGSIGVLGQAVVTAPTFETALNVLCRYMRLYADVSYAATTIGDEQASFDWAYSPLIAARDVMCDRAACLFKLRVRYLFGEGWEPLSVHLQRPRPVDVRPYRELLSRTVVFDATLNRIVLRRADLELSNTHADPYAHETALVLADRMMAERRIPDSISIRAREDVLHHLADGGPNINETARRLGMSPRSLQRRLDDLGTSYQRLSDEARQGLAEELLAQTDLPMGEIAYRLGFANQANLTRASKRWFDRSPRQVRTDALGARP